MARLYPKTLASIVALMLTALAANTLASDTYVKLQYEHWTIIYNCVNRGYEWFRYETVEDQGQSDRVRGFHDEERLPEECRQKSTGTYKRPKGASTQYHRGHGIHQNLWDHDEAVMEQSNSMANILPQAATLNSRGAWRHTEKLTECWRDKGTVTVWGGVIWGNNPNNDHFLDSHGVVTPDYLWKVIVFPGGNVNAWIFPNTNNPTAKRIDRYLVSPEKVTELTGVRFPFKQDTLEKKAPLSESMPSGCSLA